MTTPNEAKQCQICGAKTHLNRCATVRPAIANTIQNDLPHFDSEGWICDKDLDGYRNRYIQGLLTKEKGEISDLEREVLDSLRDNDIIAKNPEVESDGARTLGEAWADRIASFGGSWTFILSFLFFILLWVVANSWLLLSKVFDPYPFILLNLMLSCLAALQAPVIIMSQRRQEDRDRQRAVNDYQINLKAELEIRHLHQKVDHLLTHQWDRLIEIQNIQMEMMEEIRGKKSDGKK
jgi:uncharacterized membrane protein